MSKAAPTPNIVTPPQRPQCSFIQISCFGVPSPTQTKSDRASRIARQTSASSCGLNGRKGGLWYPAITMLGYFRCRLLIRASATPGSPPKKKCRQPLASPRSQTHGRRSGPHTRDRPAIPASLLTHTSGIPSAVADLPSHVRVATQHHDEPASRRERPGTPRNGLHGRWTISPAGQK